MRYYVVSIQYNKEVNAENRTAPKAFDDYNSAKQSFHEQLGRDMNNATLGWGLVMIFNSSGQTLNVEKWSKEDAE